MLQLGTSLVDAMPPQSLVFSRDFIVGLPPRHPVHRPRGARDCDGGLGRRCTATSGSPLIAPRAAETEDMENWLPPGGGSRLSPEGGGDLGNGHL